MAAIRHARNIIIENSRQTMGKMDGQENPQFYGEPDFDDRRERILKSKKPRLHGLGASTITQPVRESIALIFPHNSTVWG